jgi:putative chitobiose transport system permease protein
LLVLFFFIPFFETLALSFKSFDSSLYHPVFCGFDNYIKVLSSPSFSKVLINTLLYLIVATPVLVVLPIIIAIALNQKIRGISIYRAVIYIPTIVSLVVAAIAFKWLYANEGLLNYFIGLFGIEKIGWLTDPNVALYSVIILTIWKGLGYYAIIYLASLLTIPDTLYEAAEIDGANTLQKHLKITLPFLSRQ